MSHSPFTPATADALAAGRALRVERARFRRALCELPTRRALKIIASAVERADRQPIHGGARVGRLVKSVKRCGQYRVELLLELAAERAEPIADDARLGDLSDEQRSALAWALRDVAEYGWTGLRARLSSDAPGLTP